MPYCDGGELFDYVSDTGALEEEVARNLFLQLLTGLEYLQQMGICHRDMSLENLLITGGNQCVIIDLGMCLRVCSQPLNMALPHVTNVCLCRCQEIQKRTPIS